MSKSTAKPARSGSLKSTTSVNVLNGVKINYSAEASGSVKKIGTFTDNSLTFIAAGDTFLVSLPYGTEIESITAFWCCLL